MSENNQSRPRLIADIGGTNARFALFDGQKIYQETTLACADYPSLTAAIEHYLNNSGEARPQEAAIAVATPVDRDRIKLTNHVWEFSISETCRELQFQRLKVINDFTALALSLPHLDAAQLQQIGTGEAEADETIALIGPGTGLGVSGLVPSALGWIPLQSEGGHVTYGAINQLEAEILALLAEKFPHVSAERLLSGSGLQNLYWALAQLQNPSSSAQESVPTPAAITERGLSQSCEICTKVLEIFCAMLGTVAGNLVLTLGAKGGVYIGGGIVPRLGEYFQQSSFRQRFEHRGRFSDYLAAVPSYLITAHNPALIGSAQAFADLYQNVGVSSSS